MSRTIVHERVPIAKDLAAKGVAARGTLATEDTYTERLVKYVPAEVLAFFVPISTQVGDNKVLLWVTLVVGIAGTIGYLYLHARKQAAEEKTGWYFYPLAAIAFLAWAIGTNEQVAGLVGLSQSSRGVILGLCVFAIPLLDEILSLATKKGGGTVNRRLERLRTLQESRASSP